MAQRITREDLEGKFRSVQTDLQTSVDNKKNSIATAAVVGGVVLLLIFFMLAGTLVPAQKAPIGCVLHSVFMPTDKGSRHSPMNTRRH